MAAPVKELTDAEVFGTQKELSDADVFGTPAPSMADKLKPVTDAASAGLNPIAGLESAAHLVSGVVAYPAGVVAGLGTAAANAAGLTDKSPLDVQQKVANALTYQPMSAGGKQLAQGSDQAIDTIIGKPINTLASGAQSVVQSATGSKLAGEAANLATQGAAIVLPGHVMKGIERAGIRAPLSDSDVGLNAKPMSDADVGIMPAKNLADAVIQVESGGNPNAINSKTGAAGLGQFMPATAKALGIDPMDPVQARQGVNKYLDYLQQKFGNIDHTLMAYNWGEGNVQHWLNGDINPKTGKRYTPPKETTQYVAKVKAEMGQSPVVQQLQAIRPSVTEAEPESPKPEGAPIPEEFPIQEEASQSTSDLIPENPALDMSTEARQQRASDMGFNIDAYHGTTGDVHAFDSQLGGSTTGQAHARDAFFFAENPEVANQYSVFAKARAVADWERYDDNLKAAKTPEEKAYWQALKDEVEPDAYEATGEAFRANAENRDFNQGANVLPVRLRLKNPYTHDAGGKELSDAAMSHVLKTARDAGHDGVVFKNMIDTPYPFEGEQGKVYAVFDANNVRSRHAAFDPSKSDSITLMHAGIPLDRIPEAIRGAVHDIKNTEIGKDITEKVLPIASSPEWAQKVGKEFINKNRLSENQFSQIDKLLTDNFTSEQRQRMFQAADEESVAAQEGKSLAGTGTGYERLTPEEKSVVDDLHQRVGDALWKRSVKNGLASGNGLPEYVPRSVVIMKPDGSFERVPQQQLMQAANGAGFNLTTRSSNLKSRNYLTLAETEAAARKLFGPEAMVANDIRVLPMAYARLERANHGVEFVKALKEASKKAGLEAVANGDQPGYVTYDHPALTQGVPRFVEENGKLRPLKDETGKPIIDRVPLKIHKDLKGVVSAVLDRPSGALYKGFMAAKAGAMQMIMYSPLIHNAVEYGRAFPVAVKDMITPAATTKTIPLKIYKMGNDAKNTPSIMREAILAGLDPIGGRYAIKDATGIMNELTLNPGKSLTAKAAGKVAGLVSPEASLKTRAAIDKAGEFWHNKLLWDRVGDLQMGIYLKLRDEFQAKGLTPHNAQVLAAHGANRFAGALPKETMSKGIRAASHVALFSPSFTYGNLGVLKDTVMGLPGHVRSLIEGGQDQVKLADSLTRKKSFGTVVVDIGLNLAMVAAASTALAHFAHNQTWEQIWEDYKRRAATNLKNIHEHPQKLLNPINVARGFLPQSENEQGKENRVLAGYDKNGTAIYLRIPFGKIGEEFESYLGSPLQIMKNKESTFIRPLLQTLQNDKGNGQKVYLEKDPALKEAADIALNALSQQIPMDAIESGRRAIAGKEEGKRGIDAARTLAPLAGITVSQGFPGGPAESLAFHNKKDLADMRARELPEINSLIREGNLDDAVQKMQALNMTGGEIRARIKGQLMPQSRLSAKNLQEFYRTASPDDQERMSNLLNH